jgi:hypothetical protein
VKTLWDIFDWYIPGKAVYNFQDLTTTNIEITVLLYMTQCSFWNVDISVSLYGFFRVQYDKVSFVYKILVPVSQLTPYHLPEGRNISKSHNVRISGSEIVKTGGDF